MFATWRLAVYGAVAAALVAGVLWYGHGRYEAGRTAAQALQAKREAAATAAHEALIAQLDEAHNAALQTLEAQRDAATARVVTRVIRMPVPAACPAPGAEDAGVPVQGPAKPEYVEVDDRGYDSFRKWLVRYATTADVGGGTATAVSGGN